MGFYDRTAWLYDYVTWGFDRRYAESKRRTFAHCRGRTLLVGVGTGRDLSLLPGGLELTAIDLSAAMLERARRRVECYSGSVELMQADIENTPFAEGSFDTIVGSCVLCSVRHLLEALLECRRLLSRKGRLILFEHTASSNPLLQPMLHGMNLLLPGGPRFTRRTEYTVREAGFEILEIHNFYMDIVKGLLARPLNHPEDDPCCSGVRGAGAGDSG